MVIKDRVGAESVSRADAYRYWLYLRAFNALDNSILKNAVDLLTALNRESCSSSATDRTVACNRT